MSKKAKSIESVLVDFIAAATNEAAISAKNFFNALVAQKLGTVEVKKPAKATKAKNTAAPAASAVEATA